MFLAHVILTDLFRSFIYWISATWLLNNPRYFVDVWITGARFTAVSWNASILHNTKFYYRASRDAIRNARSLLSPGVRRPSVRLSVTLVHYIHMAEDIVKLLCRPDSPIILVFLTLSAGTNSKGNSLSGDAKYKGVGKVRDFRLKSPSISETVWNRPMIAMER